VRKIFLGELGLGYLFIPFSLKKSLDVYFVFFARVLSMKINDNLRKGLNPIP
jgi:hypothetical protein